MPSAALSDSMPNFTNKFFDEGRYKLLDQLGSGAYGKVYRALDTTSPSTHPVHYAVKCLVRPKPGSRQDDFQRREFNLHNMVCAHPNIVTIHKVVVQGEFVFVILDLCAGGDLFTAITENQVFSGRDDLVKKSFIELLDAIHWCHEKGVFHRDIKPENVLCSEDGSHLRLADFGLSTRQRVSRDFGCGSSYYMSPECIGKEVRMQMYSTRHSDVWSLGVILVNMITGRNPWRYATTKDDCFAAFIHDTDFLLQVLPISSDANEVIKRIFTLNPQERINLPDLREEILKLDTFFMSQKDLALASDCVRDAARGYGLRVPPARITRTPIVTSEAANVDTSSDDQDSAGSSSSEEDYLYPSPGEQPSPPTEHLDLADLRIVDSNTINNGPIDRTSSESSAGDSEGPVTPETYPVDPDVEIPDISEELDQPVVTDRESTLKAPSKPSQFLQRAVQRLKGISTGSLAF
ncbi:hypothetical protein PC9H_004968 [Pleurotus ostreatus]|uniref:non-specific serine/threonine protein kinase n=3 Tax=Pleurotus ostreatus TaxID=5322 RepID=A0A8H7A2Z4_PLEOS|nr:uncharacterized protein PC9H_004968 [Pleurotus ostreatus]KAF7433022.1 hypothetical protein PC9H_004968 [Pleurotus ostreatus]KAJ8698371.1 hypothetical protein PTI98_005085 [Pleurotus ostreatus]